MFQPLPDLISYICWNIFQQHQIDQQLYMLVWLEDVTETTMWFVSVGDVQVQVWCPLHWRVCWEQETWPGGVQLSWWIPVWWLVSPAWTLQSPYYWMAKQDFWVKFNITCFFLIKESGQMMWEMGSAPTLMPMGIRTKASGATTWGTGRGRTRTQTLEWRLDIHCSLVPRLHPQWESRNGAKDWRRIRLDKFMHFW